MESSINVAYSPKDLISKMISEGKQRRADASPVIASGGNVLKTASKLHKPVTFTSQKGKRYTFIIFENDIGLQGIANMCGVTVLPARFPYVEICPYYDCFIVGDKDEKGILTQINRIVFGDERQGWEAFSLDGSSLLNGQRFETKRQLYHALGKITKEFYREDNRISSSYLDSVKVYAKPSFKTRIRNMVSFVTGHIKEFFQNIFRKNPENKGKREV